MSACVRKLDLRVRYKAKASFLSEYMVCAKEFRIILRQTKKDHCRAFTKHNFIKKNDFDPVHVLVLSLRVMLKNKAL